MSSEAINETKQWLKDIVIGLNFCPFAKKIFNAETIHFFISEAKTIEEALVELIDQCQNLDKNEQIETSLIIYTNQNEIALKTNDFFEYLNLLDLANDLLATENYEGVYQLASFHPKYQFENTQSDDAENYTNRSPYPMLHLLREKSMTKAIENFPNADDIPARNIQTAVNKGVAFFTRYLENVKRAQ